MKRPDTLKLKYFILRKLLHTKKVICIGQEPSCEVCRLSLSIKHTYELTCDTKTRQCHEKLCQHHFQGSLHTLDHPFAITEYLQKRNKIYQTFTNPVTIKGKKATGSRFMSLLSVPYSYTWWQSFIPSAN